MNKVFIYFSIIYSFIVFGCSIELRQIEPYKVDVTHTIDIAGARVYFRKVCLNELELSEHDKLNKDEELLVEECIGEKIVNLIESLSNGEVVNVPNNLIIK